MQEPLEGLVLRADVALYKAKKSGRDRVELAEVTDPDGVRLQPDPDLS